MRLHKRLVRFFLALFLLSVRFVLASSIPISSDVKEFMICSIDDVVQRPTEGHIPKILHQIWIGGKMPEHFSKFIDSWKLNHPTWTYIFWDDEKAKEFDMINRSCFDGAKNWGQKADILRYEILAKFGGVYVDLDMESITPLDALNERFDFYSCELAGSSGNAVIGCTANHPVITNCIETIKKNGVKWGNFQDIMETSGPYLFAQSINDEYSKHSVDWKRRNLLLSEYLCYSFPADLRFDYWSSKLPAEVVEKYRAMPVYMIHYWACSWQKSKQNTKEQSQTKKKRGSRGQRV